MSAPQDRAWRGVVRSWWTAIRAIGRPSVGAAWPTERELPQAGTHASIVLTGKPCTGTHQCVAVCPTACLYLSGGTLELDHGACVACGLCVSSCPCDAVVWSEEPADPATRRDALVVRQPRPDAEPDY